MSPPAPQRAERPGCAAERGADGAARRPYQGQANGWNERPNSETLRASEEKGTPQKQQRGSATTPIGLMELQARRRRKGRVNPRVLASNRS
jgi:hypothetical protein